MNQYMQDLIDGIAAIPVTDQNAAKQHRIKRAAAEFLVQLDREGATAASADPIYNVVVNALEDISPADQGVLV